MNNIMNMGTDGKTTSKKMFYLNTWIMYDCCARSKCISSVPKK